MSPSDTGLPPLREDLCLYEAAPARDGTPTWSIQDPVSNRFFQIGWLEFECLLRWSTGNAEAIARDIAASTPLASDAEQVTQFGQFLAHHHLLRPTGEAVRKLATQAGALDWRHWRWWLHHYLFIRIPLIHPERWLNVLLPYARPLFSQGALSVLILSSLLGLIMVSRQWEVFTHQLLDILTPAGILGFVLALIISKTLHELGHALVSTHFGARVSHMGVAFVVLWPMLYTDTGESWKLRSASQRLRISAAGISVEMALAGLSTLAWALLDDGALRQAMLYLATTGWALSLALNVSPFMRFDGYFILSDLLDFPNLHERSGAMARVWLRRVFLGWSTPYPESFADHKRRLLIAFAVTTWVYRLLIFAGIALAVYFLFFKVLGILLFAVEIFWFIVRPVWSEVSLWRAGWGEVKARRRRWLLWAGLFGLGLLMFPWAFEISAPGVATPARKQIVFSPFPAHLDDLKPPGPVLAGGLLASFHSPDLDARAQQSTALTDSLGQRLAGLIARENGIDQQKAMTRKLDEQLAEGRGIHDEAARLSVYAEFDGTWLDIDPALKPGVWVGTKNQIGVLVDKRQWIVDAYVSQTQVARIKIGNNAHFRVTGNLLSVDAQVIDIDSTRSNRLAHQMLDTRHGGPISTRADNAAAMPVEALYRVRLALNEPLAQNQEARGQATIEGTRRSLLWGVIEHGASTLIRESGF